MGTFCKTCILIIKIILTEQKLIRKLKKGDEKAIQQLYQQYACELKYLLYRYLKDETLAEDLLQEGFLLIISKVHQFKGIGSFIGWIKRIFTNLALGYLRKNKNRLLVCDDYNKDDVPDEFISKYDNEIDIDELDESKVNMDVINNAGFTDKDLEKALFLLPEQYRTVFNLFVIDEYTHKEISELLEINEKTSRSRLSKARKKTQLYLYHKAIQQLKEISILN